MARRLAELPYTEIEALLAAETPLVAILPVGATESHGPHLPINTDVVISEAFATQAADLLESNGEIAALILPSLAYTPAGYASPFAGTLSLDWEVAQSTIEAIGAGLKRQGFACLALANSHFDPMNVNVLRLASESIEAAGLPVAFADATRRRVAALLTEEFQSGDCHGGQFETSIVMAARPELVKEDARKSLPAKKIGLIDAIQSKGADTNFQEIGMAESYCGDPASASSEEGNASISILAKALADAVLSKLAQGLSTPS